MILAATIGFALETWADVPNATRNGLALGLLAALFVPPGNPSCAPRRRAEDPPARR